MLNDTDRDLIAHVDFALNKNNDSSHYEPVSYPATLPLSFDECMNAFDPPSEFCSALRAFYAESHLDLTYEEEKLTHAQLREIFASLYHHREALLHRQTPGISFSWRNRQFQPETSGHVNGFEVVHPCPWLDGDLVDSWASLTKPTEYDRILQKWSTFVHKYDNVE